MAIDFFRSTINMPNQYPLPHDSSFGNAEEYVESLLSFATSSELFQKLCGGVHILDFLAKEPDLYTTVLPSKWRNWFLWHDVPTILDLLMREDISVIKALKLKYQRNCGENITWRDGCAPPESLLDYIITIRKHALERDFSPYNKRQESKSTAEPDPLPRHVAIGMKPKKIHEVQNFVKYIDDLTAYVASFCSHQITHIVDFGSGQNYLGRALASPPYDKQVIALESKQLNIEGAQNMDITARLARKEKLMRNKKQYRQGQAEDVGISFSPNKFALTVKELLPATPGSRIGGFLANSGGESKKIEYVETVIKDGDLSKIVAETRSDRNCGSPSQQLMVVSLHSCGNLLHHGLRSLIVNPSVKVVAMIGCCYNLVTERLGPPTYKLPSLRSSNARLNSTSSACDPQGFPMSELLTSYKHQYGEGIRLNITARMMAVQAPENWTATDCESFFTRHFYRALIQKIFLDRGVLAEHTDADFNVDSSSPRGWAGEGLVITIGSLRKACYTCFLAYVRGAVRKLAEADVRGAQIAQRMDGLTDEDISAYEDKHKAKKKELSILWSLMAFSASVVESVIVVDRWLFLKEQQEVKDCWVETVFDYSQSPRNLVVVGIKK